MKKAKLRLRFIVIVILGVILSTIVKTSNAQGPQNFLDMLTYSTQDASLLAKNWFNPAFKGRTINMNTGWYNTANPLKLGRFEIRLIASAAFVPDEDQFFDLNDLDLKSIRLKDPNGNSMAPTLFSKSDDSPVFQVYTKNPLNDSVMVLVDDLTIPNGSPIPIYPGFTPQLCIGLMKGTEIMIRYIPVDYQGFKTDIWGVGLKHSISQHLPIAESIPGLDISVIGQYSAGNMYFKGTILEPISGFPNPEPQDYASQEMKLKSNAYGGSLVASFKIPVITGYVGLNYSGASHECGTYGYFPVPGIDTAGNTQIINLKDPIKFKIANSQFSATGGVRFKLPFMAIGLSGSYAPGGYSSAMFTLGFGYLKD